MDSAILSLIHGRDLFSLFLPYGGGPRNMATILETPTYHLKPDAGEIMALIIQELPHDLRARLLPDEHSVKADFSYAICVHTIHRFGRTVVANNKGYPTFVGSFKEFAKWAEKQTGLEAIVGKVVQFVYKGGSVPGETRTVRVDEVKNENGRMSICGYDLSHMELKKGYRRYLKERVDGEIIVIN